MRLTAPLAGEFVELLEKLGWAGAVPVKWRARA
jgi:hypothetical protein